MEENDVIEGIEGIEGNEGIEGIEGIEDNSLDLNVLLKSFNRLDNYIAKYIYNKYLKKEFESKSKSENNSEICNSSNNNDNYKQYLNTIFSLERPFIITQKDCLEKDLENMEIADEEYDKDPKIFKVRQFDSLPDIKRCSYIRKHKNKYKRCANGILDDDSDMCYKHIKSKNMYWDKYCEVLESLDR